MRGDTETLMNWLVVSTHLKKISQNGNLPQIEVKIKDVWNHHLVKPQISYNGSIGFLCGEASAKLVQLGLSAHKRPLIH